MKYDISAAVERIEYDPNRSAYIALIKYEDNTYAYIAGGMTKDEQAAEAIKASTNVISKTEELQSTKDK